MSWLRPVALLGEKPITTMHREYLRSEDARGSTPMNYGTFKDVTVGTVGKLSRAKHSVFGVSESSVIKKMVTVLCESCVANGQEAPEKLSAMRVIEMFAHRIPALHGSRVTKYSEIENLYEIYVEELDKNPVRYGVFERMCLLFMAVIST